MDDRSTLVIYHMKQILIIFGQSCNPEDDEKILLSRINQYYQVKPLFVEKNCQKVVLHYRLNCGSIALILL